jgi:hypothetical protein
MAGAEEDSPHQADDPQLPIGALEEAAGIIRQMVADDDRLTLDDQTRGRAVAWVFIELVRRNDLTSLARLFVGIGRSVSIDRVPDTPGAVERWDGNPSGNVLLSVNGRPIVTVPAVWLVNTPPVN